MSVLIFLMILAVVSGARIIVPRNDVSITIPVQLIGAPDSHGCTPGAGYNYCNYTDSCHHFEEPCFFIESIKTMYINI